MVGPSRRPVATLPYCDFMRVREGGELHLEGELGVLAEFQA